MGAMFPTKATKSDVGCEPPVWSLQTYVYIKGLSAATMSEFPTLSTLNLPFTVKTCTVTANSCNSKNIGPNKQVCKPGR